MKKFLLFTLLVIMFTFTISAKSDNSIYNFEKEVKKILKKTTPSIVKVVAENHRKYIATGIVINKFQVLSNIMVTRYHYNKIYIETKEGVKIPVKLVGKDKRTGLILLEYKNKKLSPIKIGKAAEIGDWVVLIGAFYNKLPAIYNGIVSSSSKDELILNAPIPPGGIGSAVLNRDGDLIGVVRGRLKFSSSPSYIFKSDGGNITISSKKSKGENLCYAVPIQRIKTIVSQLKKYGKAKWGWLGVNIDLYKTKRGVLITSIIKDSPASSSELRKGDIIVNINNKDINTVKDLQRAIRRIMPGTKVKFLVVRNGKNKSYSVKIGEKKGYEVSKTYKFDIPEGLKNIKIFDEISRFPKIDIEKFKINILGTPKLGVMIKELNEKDAIKFKSKKNYGLLVTDVIKNSAAKKYGIKKWDILIGSNGKKIKTNNDLRSILIKSNPMKKIPFIVSRNGEIKTIHVIPKHNYTFNKDILRESLKDISLFVSDEFDFNNKMRINDLKRKLKILHEKEKHISANDKDKIKKEISMIKLSIKKRYKLEYKKMKEEQLKIKKKLKALEKKLNE